MSTVAEIVTEKIMDSLKKGVIPWHKPWRGGEAVNYVTQKPYRGINRYMLDGGEYITYKQLQTLGGKVKKGCKAHMVVFYKVSKYTTESDGTLEAEEKTSRILRYYNVFDIKDCEGVESKRENIHEPIFSIDECEEVVVDYTKKYNINYVHTNEGSAYYSDTTNSVNVPPITLFESSEEYYSTVFHELVHSTGNESRLNRDLTGKFGTKSYAKEELVAEVGSAMLCSMLGVDTQETLDNSAAYCESWMKKLGENPNLILYASAKAEKATEMIAPGMLEIESPLE